MSVRPTVSNGSHQPSLLQALPPAQVLRDRHETRVHPHRGGEGSEEVEDRREQVTTSVIFVTKIKTRTRIIGRRFQRTRTRIITKTK